MYTYFPWAFLLVVKFFLFIFLSRKSAGVEERMLILYFNRVSSWYPFSQKIQNWYIHFWRSSHSIYFHFYLLILLSDWLAYFFADKWEGNIHEKCSAWKGIIASKAWYRISTAPCLRLPSYLFLGSFSNDCYCKELQPIF